MAVLPGGLPWVWGSQTSRLLPASQGRWTAKGVREPTRQPGLEPQPPPFGEYFRIDEQNKFISERAKFSSNVFSFPALKVDETRAENKLKDGEGSITSFN